MNILYIQTEGHTSGPNEDVDVENCQVLGIIEDLSKEGAINKLFEQNVWIHRVQTKAPKSPDYTNKFGYFRP